MSANEFVEVPEPLFKFKRHNTIIHDDNQRIIDLHKRTGILKKREVKKLEKQLKAINRNLKRAKIFDLLKKREELRQLRAELKLELGQVPEDEDTPPDLKRRIIRANRQYAKVMQRLRPFRGDLQMRAHIKRRLTTHHAQLADEKKEAVLQKEMAEEASYFADRISRELGRMGYKYLRTIRNRSRTDYVMFDYVIVTPDQIQLKILTGKKGYIGGYIPLLPQGVLLTEILTEKTLQNLTTALEREVWSPHVKDGVSTVNGAWLVVERLGLVEGIQSSVTYRQLMARYETANHERIPIPAGLMRGRRINWVHLDSPHGIHMMFTGISGSGKSNAMRAMITAIVETQSPNECMMTFIDLKKSGDFAELAEAPHCIDNTIIEEIPDVVTMLQRIQGEMHTRQERLKATGAKNIRVYNQRVSQEHRMPHILIVFDEYANTRREAFKDERYIIDDICVEIGQVGRSAGVHLMIGVQQSRSDNMPSPLKDNIITTFDGHQQNVGAAMAVKGNRDALKLEDIPGRFSASVGHNTYKVQMPLIEDHEVENIVQSAIEQWGDKPRYEINYLLDMTPPEATQSLEEMILETAFLEFDGDLKARRLWEFFDKKPTLNDVKEAVNNLIEQDFVEWDGNFYKAQLQFGNFYKFELLEEITVASTVAQDNKHEI